MKFSTQQYAQALYEAIQENPKKEDEIVKLFVNQLFESGELHKAKSIMSKFSDIYNKKNNSVDVVIESREGLTSTEQKKIQTEVNKIIKGELNISYQVNDQILGGINIVADSVQVDLTVNGFLAQFKENNI